MEDLKSLGQRMFKMNSIFKITLIFSGILIAKIFAEDKELKNVQILPMQFSGAQELGYVMKGLYAAGNANAYPETRDWLDHFSASITAKAIVADRFNLSAGLGGVFQFRKPEIVNGGFSGSQRKSFFVGPVTEATYHFGEITDPWLKLGVGNWFYKYNTESFDLGEYLFRSGAYPTYTITGGYNVVGSANAQMQGFKALFQWGNLKADLFLTTQTTYAPLYDWSPAAVLNYKMGNGLFEFGAGANFTHFFQVNSSRSSVHRAVNGYFITSDGKEYSANTDYYHNRLAFDQVRGNVNLIYNDSVDAALVDAVVAAPPGTAPAIQYFDSKATLLMAKISFDPKKFFSTTLLGENDLKLYSELGVLGLENKPVFYKKVTERMPVMIGFNLPTFKLLDLFAVQAEYLNSPYMNNTYQIGNFAANVPYIPLSSDTIMSRVEYNDMAERDNLKWAVIVKKNFGKLTFAAQAANDHLRVTSSEYYYGPQYDHGEITVSKDHWYFMTQVAWGL